MSECHCEACDPIRIEWTPEGHLHSPNMRMILCAICGNKRCPHATDHRNACTNSNEPGQKGSSWEHYKVPTPAALDAGNKGTDGGEACGINEFSSRICERGTKGCTVTPGMPGRDAGNTGADGGDASRRGEQR